MKDRIKNDRNLDPGIRNTIESEVEKFPALEITADLANRFKHFTLEKYIRKDAEICNRIVNIRADVPGAGHAKIRYRNSTEDGEFFELTDQVDSAVRAWQKILNNYGIET